MITLIVVGKVKDKNLSGLSAEYLKRLQPYHKTKIIEVRDFANNNKIDAKAEEAQLILKHLKPQDYVIALDLLGIDINSVSLSELIDRTFISHPNIVFIIGGSLGLADEVLARANFKWKLSNLTFTHQFVRVMILEQIYRSFKILAKEPYHK